MSTDELLEEWYIYVLLGRTIPTDSVRKDAVVEFNKTFEINFDTVFIVTDSLSMTIFFKNGYFIATHLKNSILANAYYFIVILHDIN